MPSQRLLLNDLGGLELAVLDYLWNVEGTSVKELHQAVGRERGVAVNTIGSTLARLHRKGLVTRAKVSHAYRYAAALQKHAFMVQRMLESVRPMSGAPLNTFLSAFLYSLCEEEGGTALDRLEAIVSAKREHLRLREPKPTQ